MKRKYIDFRKRKKTHKKLKNLIRVATKLAKRTGKPATIWVKPGIFNEGISIPNNVNFMAVNR